VVLLKINEVNYKWSGTLTKRTKTEMIVLHHAAAKSCTAQQIHQWHLNQNWSGIGYHFFINRSGQIFRGRPEDTIGSHTKGYNSKSIGICFEGDYMTQEMPKVQLEAGKELIAYLKDKYKITNVKGHRDLMATSCPGSKFPFDEIANSKKSITKENLVLAFQQAAIADGVQLPKYGADGEYGNETAQAMQKCVVKKRATYQYKNCTKLVQRLLGIKQDGLCGPQTSDAIKEFQKKKGLVADSCCGPKTWQKLLGIN
jgi:N-acetyl-anhydromuramyl-L-alanine amidase AmpD